MSINTAPVKWAQRKDSLYITISLPDVKDEKIELTEKKLLFSGSSSDKRYNLNLEFLKEIEVEGSISKVLASSVHFKLNKKDKESEFWPRLLLDKAQEKTNVTIDWDKYVDEDEAEGDFNVDDLSGGMDFGSLGGGGGLPPNMADFGGDDDSDDDEDLPDLEATKTDNDKEEA
mmetsp:Transcript_22633/g.20556  ORF Transcript_22633/g.20556 Transcript_22633/m.20556 type:complete len:173 (+) Transcript_22633:50-568(+)